MATLTATACLMLGGCDKADDSPAADKSEAKPETVEIADPEPAPVVQPETDFAAYKILPAVTVMAVNKPANADKTGDPSKTGDANERECTAADIYFGTDAAVLDDASKAALDRVAACLLGTPADEPVEITATADPRGTEPYNQDLSQNRAKTVAEYLASKGVADDIFEIRARGEKGVLEDVPALWPLQRAANVDPKPAAQ